MTGELTSAEIVGRYATIVAGLDEIEAAALWAATLFGRTPTSERIRVAADALRVLRDDVGRSRRKRADAP